MPGRCKSASVLEKAAHVAEAGSAFDSWVIEPHLATNTGRLFTPNVARVAARGAFARGAPGQLATRARDAARCQCVADAACAQVMKGEWGEEGQRGERGNGEMRDVNEAKNQVGG